MTPINRLPTTLYRYGTMMTESHRLCLMEAVAVYAGEHPFALPQCADPDLAVLGQAINDVMDDEPRQRLIRYIPLMVGTRDDGREVERRQKMISWANARFAETPTNFRQCHAILWAAINDSLHTAQLRVRSAEPGDLAALIRPVISPVYEEQDEAQADAWVTDDQMFALLDDLLVDTVPPEWAVEGATPALLPA